MWQAALRQLEALRSDHYGTLFLFVSAPFAMVACEWAQPRLLFGALLLVGALLHTTVWQAVFPGHEHGLHG